MHPTVHDDDRGAFVVCGRGERRAAQHCEAAAHLGRRRVWAHRCWNAGFECVSAWRQAGWLAGWRRHARASRLGLGGRAAAGAGWGGAAGRAGGAWGCERASGCEAYGEWVCDRGAKRRPATQLLPPSPRTWLAGVAVTWATGGSAAAAANCAARTGAWGGAQRRVGDMPASTCESRLRRPPPRPRAHHVQQVAQANKPSLQQPHGQAAASRRRPRPPPAWTKREVGGGGRSGVRPTGPPGLAHPAHRVAGCVRVIKEGEAWCREGACGVGWDGSGERARRTCCSGRCSIS